MTPIHHIHPLHSYRALLVPTDTDPEAVETLADAQLLPTLQLKAANATQAIQNAQRVSGKPVLRVERLEGATA